MRPDGYFRITGRAKDMIIRGGENIYPNARIRLKAGESCCEKEIRDFCEGKIAYFKIPEYIRFVDSFPMTVSGKVQKFKIREQEIRKRRLEEVAHIQTA